MYPMFDTSLVNLVCTICRAGTTDYDSVDREIGTTGGRILLPIPIHRYLAISTEYRYRTHDFC